ncbi:hypothetical protein B7463_g588, partial [Scytalidium lignicola]
MAQPIDSHQPLLQEPVDISFESMMESLNDAGVGYLEGWENTQLPLNDPVLDYLEGRLDHPEFPNLPLNNPNILDNQNFFNSEFDTLQGTDFPVNTGEVFPLTKPITSTENIDSQSQLLDEFNPRLGEYNFPDLSEFFNDDGCLHENMQPSAPAHNVDPLFSGEDPRPLSVDGANSYSDTVNMLNSIKGLANGNDAFMGADLTDSHQEPENTWSENDIGFIPQDWVTAEFDNVPPLDDDIAQSDFQGVPDQLSRQVNSVRRSARRSQSINYAKSMLSMPLALSPRLINADNMQPKEFQSPNINAGQHSPSSSLHENLPSQEKPRQVNGLHLPALPKAPPLQKENQRPGCDSTSAVVSWPQSRFYEMQPRHSIDKSFSNTASGFTPIESRSPTPDLHETNSNTAYADKPKESKKKYQYQLRKRPPEWERPSKRGPVSFHYTLYGELEHSLRFTPEEILTFIQMHPINSHFKPQHSDFGLTLWIQVTPFDCGGRYPHRESNTCRFKNCPIRTKTIRKGQFRIAFDERVPGPPKDPFHNSGYVHLYCMEKFLDFPLICKQYNVKPDNRRLQYEDKNKMSIARDHPEMLSRAIEFIKDSVPGVSRANWNYEDSLTFILTREHIYRESSSRQSLRNRRGGNHIAKWMGNLDLYAENQKKIREEKLKKREKHKQKRKQKERGRAKNRRRMRGEDSDYEYDDDDDDDDEIENIDDRADQASQIPQRIDRGHQNKNGNPLNHTTRQSKNKETRKRNCYESDEESLEEYNPDDYYEAAREPKQKRRKHDYHEEFEPRTSSFRSRPAGHPHHRQSLFRYLFPHPRRTTRERFADFRFETLPYFKYRAQSRIYNYLVRRQKRYKEKKVAGAGVLNNLRNRGSRFLRGYPRDDANVGRKPVIMSGSLPGFGGSGGAYSGAPEGRERGARRKKFAGYLKAANEIRQSYQQSYSEKWGANNTDEHWGSRSIPGEFPHAGIVMHDDEQLVLFPSYAKRHFKKPPNPNVSENKDRDGDGVGDPEYWAREWQKYEDDRAIVDVDIRGWIYSPHRGPLTRRNRLLIGIARQLSGIPAPPRGSGTGRESSPDVAPSLHARHESQREQENIAQEAEQILRKGQGEEQIAARGGYSEQPKPEYDFSGANSRSSSRSGSVTPKSYSEPEGPGHLQKKVSWNQPSDMTQEELLAANSNLMARLLPFLTNPLIAAPITVFFYDDKSSVSRCVVTDDAGHFSVRAALDFVPTHVRVLATEYLSITEKVTITEPIGVSIISDVDDTIKHTSISSGAREIFRNAFVRDLSDLSIDGVRKWYNKMYDMGVDIHYVSNSPWQLFPVLVSFFRQAGLPPGSYHLKQYSGMLQGIFEPVAERKKSTLEKIMRDFPERKFVLIGDSGEADLEVYTDVVLANPGRVIAVFIRDVTTPYPSHGFFNPTMGPLSLDQRNGKIQSPSRKGSIASSKMSTGPESIPPPLPRRPVSDAVVQGSDGPGTVDNLIDLNDEPESKSTNKPQHLADLETLDSPSRTSVGDQNRRAPPPRPAKPSSLRISSMPDLADNTSPSAIKNRVPPPPPKPRRAPGRQDPPSNTLAQSENPSNTDSSSGGYLLFAKDKVSEAYNALPEIRSHIYSNPAGTPSASPQPPEIPKTRSSEKPPPPPPRRSTAASVASMTATVTSHLPTRTNSDLSNSNTYNYASDADASAPVNKKLELWKRRWQHAKRILDAKGVALRSWRVGDDVSVEAVKMIEDAMRKMRSKQLMLKQLRMWKPFKPPLIKNGPKAVLTDPAEDDIVLGDRPTKKRRLIHVVEDSPPRRLPLASSLATTAPRKPLIPVKNAPVVETASISSERGGAYYRVLWRKFTTKKHKTWDGDGFLSVSDGYARLHDVSGREMGKSACLEPLLPGSTLSIGGKDVEVDEIISRKDYVSRRDIPNTPESQSLGSRVPSIPSKPIKTAQPTTGKSSKDNTKDIARTYLPTIPAKDFYGASRSSTSQFKTPLISSTVLPKSTGGRPTPRHDPNAPGAMVMKRPKECPKGKQIVDVVIDPFLSQKLFEHQKEGIKFLYECVMGMRDFNGQGALLADEMGLGKTLQTITLLWTLLKQNPIHGSEPVIKKALIVCPVTLIDNWKKEFRRWLGNERIGVFVADDKNTRLSDFTHGKSYSVMIIGYEKLRNVQEELKKGSGIDLVVADEGHRLKTAQNKSAQAIRSLNTPRRIILSGTPLQNDLSEFFIMVDFINPGLLGTYNSFKKEFEGPILRSREPGASENEIEDGNDRRQELSSITNMFILRRTAEVMSKFLPPKTEYVIFCKPTSVQAQVYQHVLDSPVFGKVLGSSESALQLITILKKVCNAPGLLERQENETPSSPNVAQLLESMPLELLKKKPTASSSKFRLLDRLVKELSSTTSEKIVIVSNYTSTLDLLGNHLASLGLTFLRLDGSTPSAKRQGLVESFNHSPASKTFAFLLSAKSGGVGINLVGASRLILFDVDWNPATDQQAMARIHRPGQKRPVKIYRFLMAGGMDEKIFQRQITKTGLADSVVDGKKSETSFSAEELRDLFRLDLEAECQTHDLLSCTCGGTAVDNFLQPSSANPVVVDSEEEVVKSSDDSDSDFPENLAMIIMPASKIDIAAQEKKIAAAARKKRKKQSKGKMQALMQYSHINTSVLLGETKDIFGFETDDVKAVKAALDDTILACSLEDQKCKVGFVFAKRSETKFPGAQPCPVVSAVPQDRIRRVKCDEAKPFCKRCTSTGRKCDGYAKLPPTSSVSTPSSGDESIQIIQKFVTHIPGSASEKRGFYYFLGCTARELSGYYDPSFWEQNILQAGVADPALRHAIIAIGSLHEDFSRKRIEFIDSDIGYNEPDNYFATSQYAKSIAQLRLSLESGKQGTVTALMCCILFVCFDSLRGHLGSAMIHLQSGLRILRSMKVRSESDKYLIDTYLVPIFMRLSIQSILYIDTSSKEERINFALNLLVIEEEKAKFSTPFETLEDARIFMNGAADGLFRAFYMFDGFTNLDHQLPRAVHQYHVYKDILLSWEKPFVNFLAKKSKSFTKKEVRGAALLKVQHTTAKIMATIAPMQLDSQRSAASEMDELQKCLPEFETIVNMSRSLIQAGEEDARSGSPPLAFSTDLGIVAPLYYVCVKCPSTNLRNEAIELLDRAPRKEGMWDSKVGVKLIKEFWEYEKMHKALQGISDDDYTPVPLPLNQVIDLELKDGMRWSWKWIEPSVLSTRLSTPDDGSIVSSNWTSEQSAYPDLDYFFGSGAMENFMNYESWDDEA